MGRKLLIAVAFAAAVAAGCGRGGGGARGPGEEVDSASLRDTVVLPTLDAPLPAGKSAVW